MKAWITMVAVVAAAGLAVGGCRLWKRGDRGAPSASTTPVSLTVASDEVATPVDESSESSASELIPGLHECLTTPEGLRRKLVTRQSGLRCVDSMEGGRLVGDELPLFQELFVLEAFPSVENPEWYLVSMSPRRAHQRGFIRKVAVAEWNNRLGLRPISPVLFYAERAHAEELAMTGRTSGSPLGRAEPDTGRDYLPWPIVASGTVTNPRGQIVEVALLALVGEHRVGDEVGEDADSVVHYSDERKKEILKGTNVVCVAFCVDNTNSTDEFVPGIIQFIENTSNIVYQQRPKLRLALTLYRDDVLGLKWEDPTTGTDSITKTYWSGIPQGIEPFLEEARTIRAPSPSSVDWPECSYQGLVGTLTATRWDKLSHKVIVWISDNSAHPKGSAKNPDVGPKDVIRLANGQGVTIHAVAIEGGGGEIEQSQHLEQCREIAEATDGKVYQVYGLNDEARTAAETAIAAEIAKAVEKERDNAGKNARELDLIFQGKMTVKEYMATRDEEDLRRRYRFVRLLNSAGVDLDGIAANQPTFVEGWVATQLPNGQPMFERMVYVSRVELDVLLSELNNLVALLRYDGTYGVRKAFEIGLGCRVGDQSFFSSKREGDIPFDVFMAARGIPLRTGITMMTREELLAMSAEDKLLLKAKLVDEVIPDLTSARSSADFKLTGDFDFGWIAENRLP